MCLYSKEECKNEWTTEKERTSTTAATKIQNATCLDSVAITEKARQIIAIIDYETNETYRF